MSLSSPRAEPCVEIAQSARSYRDSAPSQPGFTLLELMAALTIIGVLTALMVSGSRYAVRAGMIARAKSDLAGLTAALESYRRAYGDYPRTDRPDDLLQALIGRRGPTGGPLTGRASLAMDKFRTSDAADPFASVEAKIIDPWSTPYVYAYRSDALWTNPGYVLYSCGPDAEASALLEGGAIDELSSRNLDNIYAGR